MGILRPVVLSWIELEAKGIYSKPMNLTIHRGTHEIGGSCVEVESGKTRILLDFGMIFPNMPLVLIFFPFFPIKAKYMVIAMGLIELIEGLTRTGGNIAHFAHLGGMLFGFILIKYWNTSRQNFY